MEARYVFLSRKALHESLSDKEMEEVEAIQKELGIEPCAQCEGVGGFDVPSMLGYGTEFNDCSKCEGMGETNIPSSIYEVLKELYATPTTEELYTN